IFTLTLHSRHYDANQLRQVATRLEDEIRTLTDVSETFIVGGKPRQISVTLDPARLMATGTTPGEVAQALEGANARLQAGEFAAVNEVGRVGVGAGLAAVAEVGSVLVSARVAAPVDRRHVATVREDSGEVESYVSHAERGGGAMSALTR